MKINLEKVKIFIICLVIFNLITSFALGNGFTDYIVDRGYDFTDFLRIELGAPYKIRAIGVKARATYLAQLGIVYFEGEQIGIDRRAAFLMSERRFEGGFGPYYFSRVENDVEVGNQFTDVESLWSLEVDRGIVRNDSYWDDGRGELTSIGAEIQTGVLPGLDLGIYPMEVLDFILGILYLDPQRDDLSRIEKYAQLQEEKIKEIVKEPTTDDKTAVDKSSEKPKAEDKKLDNQKNENEEPTLIKEQSEEKLVKEIKPIQSQNIDVKSITSQNEESVINEVQSIPETDTENPTAQTNVNIDNNSSYNPTNIVIPVDNANSNNINPTPAPTDTAQNVVDTTQNNPAAIDNTTIVFLSVNPKLGKKYHKTDCPLIKDGKSSLLLRDAKAGGFSPCPTCKP